MAYTFDEPRIGMLQIANVDTGISYTSPAGVTTIIPTPPNVLGSVVRAFDPTYGEGEFILLKGVTSTAVGSLVVYDGTTYATTLAPTTAAQARPVAWAMSANTSSTAFGWYQISGTVVAVKSAVAIAPRVAIGVNSTGKIGNTGTGKEIEAARSANLATVASATTTVTIVVNRPNLQGRIT